MGLPEEIDDYIKETIDYTLGLPVSARTLELKLQAYEKSQKQLRDQYFLLRSKLKEKDEIIQRARVCTSPLFWGIPDILFYSCSSSEVTEMKMLSFLNAFNFYF